MSSSTTELRRRNPPNASTRRPSTSSAPTGSERAPSSELRRNSSSSSSSMTGGGALRPMRYTSSQLGLASEEHRQQDYPAASNMEEEDEDEEEIAGSGTDEYYASTSSEGQPDGHENHEESFSGPLHYLPVIVAVVPPLGAVLHGRAEAWTDLLILLLVAFYLYQIVRVPWELYYASRTRRINEAMHVLTDEDDASTPESVKRRRKAAQAELYQQELLSLALCVLSPFIGSYLLYWVRGALSDPDRYINPFNVRLFVLASGVKPWAHFFKLVKNRSLFLQTEVHYPVPTVSFLMKHVKMLEEELDTLKRLYATKDDVKLLRDGVDVPLTQLSKAVRRYEKKEEYLRLSSEEKFAMLSERQEEMLNEMTVSANLIEQLRKEQEKSGSLLRVLRHIFSGERRTYKAGNGQTYLWYERGPLFYMFLPIIASNRILDATGRLIEGLNMKIGSFERSGMIEGAAIPRQHRH